jgi:single-strand DNA-binding protein
MKISSVICFYPENKMSWDINKVIVVGRLSADVDLKYTPSGAAVARFGLAVGGKPKNDGSDSVSFFNIVVWGKAAENCSNYLSKGKQIALEGRLEQRSWVAQDGSKRSTIEIIADRVEFLGAPSAARGSGNGKEVAPSKPETGSPDENFYDNTDFNPSPVDPSFGTNNGSGEEPNF